MFSYGDMCSNEQVGKRNQDESDFSSVLLK